MKSHHIFSLRRAACQMGLTVLASLTLGACAVGPEFERPTPPEVKSYTRAGRDDGTAPPGASPSQPAPAIRRDWWKEFGSARIDDLVARALAHNPNVDAAVANLKQAQEFVTAQRGLFYPQVQAGYSVSRQGSGQVLASPLVTGDAIYTLHTAQLNVGFVPDVFGGNRRQVESLQAAADSQKYQLDALRTTLEANVVSAVIQEHYLAQQIVLVQQAVDAAAQQVRHTQIQVAGGYASQMDLAQQEAAYEQTAALEPPLRKQLEQTRDLLAVLCGNLPQADLDAAGDVDISLPPTLPRVLPSEFVAHRPDVRAAEEALHSTHAQIGVAVANMLPQISLSAAFGFSGPGLDNLFTDPNQIWGILGGVTAPIFAGGTLKARERAAEQAALAAQAQYKAVVLSAFQNVADTLYALDADDRALTSAQRSEVANRRMLDLTLHQFDAGYISQPQLLAARQLWIASRNAYFAAQANYLVDVVALYQALGGGWKIPD